jgi:hypothetical protein
VTTRGTTVIVVLNPAGSVKTGPSVLCEGLVNRVPSVITRGTAVIVVLNPEGSEKTGPSVLCEGLAKSEFRL